MKKRNKWFSVSIIAVLILSLLAGCGSGNDNKSSNGNQSNDSSSQQQSTDANKGNDEKITLQFASWSINEEATKGPLEAMANAFTELHPNVTIEFIGLPFGDIKQQTFVMAASDNAPDIIQTHTNWFSTYAAADFIEPLDAYLGEEYINDLFPSFKEDYTYEDKLMGIPWAASPYVLYWNKELFQQAGLELRPPATYEEMLQFAAEISKLQTDTGEPIYGLGEATDKLPINGLIALRNIYSFGGHIFNEQGEVEVNTPEVINTLNYYLTLVDQNLSPQGAKLKDLRNLFSIGRLGMYTDGYYGKAVFRNLSGKGEAFDDVWEAALIPSNVTGQSVSIGEAHGLVLSKSSKHKEMAVEFMKFLTDEEMITLYNEESDVLSARQSISQLDAFNSDDFSKKLVEQLDYIKPLPRNHPGLEQAYLEISDIIQQVTFKKLTPEKGAEELETKLKQILN